MPMQATAQTPNRMPARRLRRGSALVWGVVGLALVAGLSIAAWQIFGKEAPGGATGVALTRSDRAAATLRAFDITTTASGDLEARNKIEIRNPLEQNSTIVSIVPEGSRVSKGDLLIQLNADDLKSKIDDESLRLESARADLVAAENSYQIQENTNETRTREALLSVQLAELSLNQWLEGDDKKRRQDLDLEVSRATVELERLAQKYARSQELVAEGFLSKDECDRDEVEYIRAISSYKQAFLAKDIYEKYEFPKEYKTQMSNVEKARDELERVRLNNDIELASQEARRTNQRRQVSILEGRLAKLQQQFAASTIIAPQDGLVVYGSSVDRNRWGGGNDALQIGQQVHSNQLLIILPDTSEMIAAIRVHESLTGRIESGQRVTVKVDAAGGQVFAGRVESIGVMAESGGWRDPNLREYTVRVALDRSSPMLKPAMRCEAEITIESVDEALSVPVQSVFNDGAVQYVYSPRSGKYVRVPVRVGRRSNIYAEITSGLSEGDVVLLREPAAGEVIPESWNKEALTALGYQMGPNGEILSPSRRGRPDAGAAESGRNAGEQRSTQRRPSGERAAGGEQRVAESTPGKPAGETTTETPAPVETN